MTVLSPALALAMCAMFVLTRLHRHFYIFERPFLFGLHYCLEPDPNQLAALIAATSATKNAQSGQGKKKGKLPAKQATSSSKPKLSVASLAVRRGILRETYFTSEAEFPHHKELDHMMSVLCGYLCAYLFEDVVSCFFPDLLANRRAGYVGVLAIGFATFETWRISISLTSNRVMLALTCLLWVFAMCMVSAGDFVNFVKFDQAFMGLRTSVVDLLTRLFELEETTAAAFARRTAIGARFVIATLAAVIGGSMAAPARRFSRLDYEVHVHYRRDEADEREDPYSLGRPRPSVMLVIAMDYVLPLLTVFLWCTSSREEGYGPWRIYGILACVVARFAGLRIRLQRYLDDAIDAYRRFWTEKSSSSVAEAGRMLSMQIIGTSYYLFMITMAYVAPAVVPLTLSLMAKLDGGVVSGLCPIGNTSVSSPFQVFARETAGFLAWWSIATYSFFGSVSLLIEVARDLLEPGARDRTGKLPVATSGSEKRRQKRMVQERIMQRRAEAESEKT